MGKAIIAILLSIIFYFTNLPGSGGQQLRPTGPPAEQQSYEVLGRQGQFLAEQALLRRGPQKGSEPLGTVKKGQTVTILDQSAAWYKIRLSSGQEGWVPEYTVATAAVNKKSGKIILGYYPGDKDSYESLLEHSSQLTGIAPLNWRFDSEGRLRSGADPEELSRALYFAGNQKLETYACLQLDNPYPPKGSVSAVVDTLQEWGLTGVLIDAAAIPRAEPEGFFAFLENLRSNLKEKGLTTVLALPWDAEIDYAAAGETADFLIIKSGPQKIPAAAGPPAPFPAVKEMLEAVAGQVPAEKLILGLTNSGLDWPESGSPVRLSHREVLELAAEHGANIKWDTFSRTPYFEYGAGRAVWFENRYSLKHKFELAKAYDLAGIALLQLGQEDQEIWDVLERAF